MLSRSDDDLCPEVTAAPGSGAAQVAATMPPAPHAPADILLNFTPVPVSPREDGWTPARQRGFIEALADSGSVPAAARAVGMSMEGAYRLRRRPDAADFAHAWDAAYGAMTRRLTDAAFARAIHGVASPVFFQGEQIGERIRYDERLTRFLLERHDPRGHGYLHDADPRWAAGRDPLAPKLARLPRLIAKLFGMADDADPDVDDTEEPVQAGRRNR